VSPVPSLVIASPGPVRSWRSVRLLGNEPRRRPEAAGRPGRRPAVRV